MHDVRRAARPWWPGRGRRAERGTGTLEYVAALALAAILIGAIVLPLTHASPGLPAKVRTIVCKVVSIGSGDACPTTSTDPDKPPFDPKPTRCKVKEHSEKTTVKISVAFFSFGADSGFVITTYSDGTITYTATDGSGFGLTGGVGAQVSLGKLKAGAKVDLGGGVQVGYGDTWTFHSSADVTKFQEALDLYKAQIRALQYDRNGVAHRWIHPVGIPTPDQTVRSLEVKGDVTGTAGLTLPWSKDPTSGEPSKKPPVELAQAGVKFGGSQKWTQITDSTTGNITYTTTGETSIEGSGTAGPYGHSIKDVRGTSMSITRDKSGQIVKVVLVTTREGTSASSLNVGQKDLKGKLSSENGDGNLTVTTTSLDVRTAQERDTVRAWLAQQSLGLPVTAEQLYPDQPVPGDAMQNLLYSSATVSNVTYDKVTDKDGFAAEVKLGVALGLDLSDETSDARAVSASYLGPSGPDGVRTPVDFPGCVA